MRKAHEKWKVDTRDWGSIPETELIRELWPPDGIQPDTGSPEISAEPVQPGGMIRISIVSDTEGASIGYRIKGEESWQVYGGPFEIDEAGTLQVMAHRIGFKPSEVVEWTYR